MTIMLGEPSVEALSEAVGVLREWQYDGAPWQLHPGDLGWFWRFGTEATAAAVRTWSRDGRIVAVGLLDGPTLLRLAIVPGAAQDEELARQLIEDASDPGRGVLPEGKVCIESPADALVFDLLEQAGWPASEPWSPLRLEPTEPVKGPSLRIEVVGQELAPVWANLMGASFGVPEYPHERWHAMAAGLPYTDARCLVAYDARDNAVATVTVWSAGHGTPGLIEPMGVAREHRGRGHGTAITLAGVAALQELGSSSVLVYTPSSNVGAVATYESAGFRRLPEIRDRYRDA